MRKIDLLITPVGGAVMVVVLALSAVVGVVVNFVSSEQSDLPAQTADRIAELQRNAPQASSSAGGVDIPAFELQATPETIPTAQAEPDALIWWDATATPVMPPPSATPSPAAAVIQQVVYIVMTPTTDERYRVIMSPGQYHDWPGVVTPAGVVQCHHLMSYLNGEVLAMDSSPLHGWFNSLPLSERREIRDYCRR
ncbi:MAG: hypothetical protein KDE19_15345 [Caldilineaceae bacterium]|nr:hypothetical protein [Caldilineaceae bacterium]